jgi:hypothetical protein
VTVLQILFTPVTMFAAVYYVIVAGLGPAGTRGLVLGLAWMLIARTVRSLSHLRRKPEDLVLLPVMVLVIALVALPIKTYALFTMNRQGWLTRSSALVGGEGQSEASLGAPAPSGTVMVP